MKQAHNFKDETGKTYGKLTVSRRAGERNRQAVWECLCSCGARITVVGRDLRRGHTQQCKKCGYASLRSYAVGEWIGSCEVIAVTPGSRGQGVSYTTLCYRCRSVVTRSVARPCAVCTKADLAALSEARQIFRRIERAEDIKSRSWLYEADCVVCGGHFSQEIVGASTPPLGCSKRCCRLRHDSIKTGVTRAKKAGVAYTRVDPYAIFNRDGWVCKICGKPTLRHLRGKYHGLAPELDHIIPLEHGGPHTETNVQCSHRRCNAAKLKADGLSAAWKTQPLSTAKVNAEQVIEMIGERKNGVTIATLADRYKLSVRQTRRILSGESWKSIAA